MRLSRKDLAPVLAIVAGGAISAALSFSLLEPSPGLCFEYSVTAESAPRVSSQVGTVTGEITDAQTGVPIAATQVLIASLTLPGSLSRQDGCYQLQNVPPGTYTLTLTRIGYGTTREQITVRGGQTLEQNFALSEEPLTLSLFIARARAAARQRAHSPGRFVEAMEQLESATSLTELFQPVEIRPIRQR